jgi:ComF family protein
LVATTYDGLAKIVIGRLKYERAQAAARDIAQAIARRVALDDSVAIVSHVPTANARVRARGYDQARLLARELSQELSLPHAALLARHGSVRQVGASGTQRRVQLHNVFRPLKPYLFQNADVLLIDDVLTTGATLEAAAAVLKAAGARHVYAAVFAQA